LETKWLEQVALTLEELALEFDPMESQCVQESFKEVHAHQYAKCAAHVYIKSEKCEDAVLGQDALSDSQIEEHLRQT